MYKNLPPVEDFLQTLQTELIDRILEVMQGKRPKLCTPNEFV